MLVEDEEVGEVDEQRDLHAEAEIDVGGGADHQVTGEAALLADAPEGLLSADASLSEVPGGSHGTFWVTGITRDLRHGN